MGDLISRKNVIDVIRETVAEGMMENTLELRINDLPSAEPKFVEVTIDTDERWLNRKFDVFKDRLYLNEKTMIIYVPFVSFELISKRGGTIKRIGEKE